MQKNKPRGDEIKKEIIMLLARFGWLRTVELAKLVWPEASEKNAYKYAINFVNELEEERKVISTTIEKKCGTAVFLTSKALPDLKKMSIKPMLINNSGNMTRYWRHELIGVAAYAEMLRKYPHRFDGEYLTEREILRAFTTENVKEDIGKFYRENDELVERRKIIDRAKAIKRPDLIVYDDYIQKHISVEVENATKRGKKLTPLVEYGILMNLFNSAPYCFRAKKQKEYITPKYFGVMYESSNKEKPLNSVLDGLLEMMIDDELSKVFLYVFEVEMTKTMMVESVFCSDLMMLEAPASKEKSDIKAQRESFIKVMEYRKKGLNDDGSEPDPFKQKELNPFKD